MNGKQQPHWVELIDPGVQQERTALAWERTAIATMVAGTLLARFAAQHQHWLFAGFGIAYIAAGGLTLIWASRHYVSLHARITTDEEEVVHPAATRLLGLATVSLTAIALVLALLSASR